MSPLLTTLHDLLAASTPPPTPAAGGGLPDLGAGAAPPGSEKIVTVLQWGLWAVTVACVGGVLMTAGKMAMNHRHGGGGGEAMNNLMFVLIACVIAGSATAIVGALI